ncbi:fumarylacetoacetate hydrolase family protein [Bdellovibrionota bacterium FG-1]
MDKIVCVGKNYLEHAKELGDIIPGKPVLFMKPPSCLKAAAKNGERIFLAIPPQAEELHFECEIVLKMGADGYQMTLQEAKSAIAEVSIGLDMTLRTVQAQLKKQGHPWEMSKAFLDSATVGPFVRCADFPNFETEPFFFRLDGTVRQTGNAQQMTLGVAECVAYISEHFPLKKGDLIYTGTPAGVGPVQAGQVADLSWGPLHYEVTWRPYSPQSP